MKHVGKIKSNNAKVVVAYRTLPGDPYSCLVIGTSSLGDSYHDALMNLVQDPSGQSANEFADILSVRKFPDGNNMLSWLHINGYLKKVATNSVLMTPTPQTSVALDELNQIIADQKGISLDDLAVKDNRSSTQQVQSEPETVKASTPTATELRSKADALFKEAQKLRKQADEMDPPKKRSQKITAEVE